MTPPSSHRDLALAPAPPHLAWLGTGKAHDKVLPAGVARAILARPVLIEERADGATIALSSDGDSVRVERRQQLLGPGAHPQFQTLWGWLAEREERLVRALGPIVLLGEWCYATHGVRHDALPDWFIASDVFDRATAKLWSVDRRNALCRELELAVAPEVARMKTDVGSLTARLATSASLLGAGHPAGFMVRLEQDDHLVERALILAPAAADAPEEPSTRKTLGRNQLRDAP